MSSDTAVPPMQTAPSVSAQLTVRFTYSVVADTLK
jgi:hypothetical protein